jgi:hypothetical protein
VSLQPTGKGDYPPTGVYGLSIKLDDYADNYDAATLVEAGSLIEGEINCQYDNDFFKFVPETSGRYLLEVKNISVGKCRAICMKDKLKEISGKSFTMGTDGH